MGIGGQVPLIFSSEQSQFIVGYKPRARSTVHFRDIEKSQIELPFAIQVNSGMGFELSELTHKTEDYDEFQRAIDAILQADPDDPIESTESVEEDVAISEADKSFLLLEDDSEDKTLGAKQSNETVFPEESKTLRLNKKRTVKISTSELWQAVLSTETESHPFVTVQGEVNRPKNTQEVNRPKNTQDELIVRYSSEFNVLDKFNKKDDIEAIQVIDGKDVRLGAVLLNKSGLDEVRLSKLSHKALALEENDVVYFRSRQDKASYQKRKNALERLLNREGVISNLIDYFDPESAIKDTVDYPVNVTDEDFSRYDRIDDHGNTISLNTQQREAFQQLLQNGPLSLLQGPPGTGKTEFIAAFVHYLVEKQNVKNILLVSQSHEAVNTAAERIRKHCSRLGTPLEVVRFSNREGAVSDGLKDVYSNAIVTEKRELFSAEITYRVQALSQALGLQPEYLADLVKAEFSLFKKVNQLISFVETPTDDEEDVSSIKKSIHQLEESIQQVLFESYDMEYLGKESLNSIKTKVLMQLDQAYAIQPNESQRAKALVKISVDMLEVLETDRVNYDEFLARSRQLVTGTCVGIGQWHIGIVENQYDWVIIDEAARSIASELAIAMQSAKRILLVGDHKQLPPLYSTPHKKALARKLGIASDDAESILKSDFAQAFESSYGQQAGAKLLTQYRMAKPIGNLVSNVFYDDELQNGERVIPDIYADVPEAMKSTVTWIDTSLMKNAYHQKPNRGSSIYNRCETDEIIALLSDISKETGFVDNLISIVKENEPAIGVICMYAEQKKLLLKKFKEQIWQDNFKSLIKIDTVDSYQGKENRIIIVSITRNIKNQSPGFLRSPNRINVAISRAMDKLVIVGATDMWKAQNDDLPLGKVFQYVKEREDQPDYQIIERKEGK